jgi:hypothetical protein
MGHSKHMQTYGSVGSCGQQCMKTQKNLFRDVAHAKDMAISIQGMPCHSLIISNLSSLISRGRITWGHFHLQRNMSICWWQWIMSPNGLKPCHAGMLTTYIKR